MKILNQNKTMAKNTTTMSNFETLLGAVDNQFSYHLAAFGSKGEEGVSLGAVKEIRKSL